MAILTCVMLVTGMLLWQKARDNKRYTDAQRKFHYKVTVWFLGICMALFPATALLFLANKIIPIELESHKFWCNAVFFGGWLGFIIASILVQRIPKVFSLNFRVGAVLALLIPVVNGVMTGDWIWVSISEGMGYVAGVDAFWLLTGLIVGGASLRKKSLPPPPKDKTNS